MFAVALGDEQALHPLVNIQNFRHSPRKKLFALKFLHEFYPDLTALSQIYLKYIKNLKIINRLKISNIVHIFFT